jgi:DNA-binding HxlR family transcriptional regulator
VDAPSVPRPGRPVRGSTTGRPLMAAMDLLGRRWALRILWELRHGPLGARALRDHCDGMSSSVLYERLGELVEARLVDQDASGDYLLTKHGTRLVVPCGQLMPGPGAGQKISPLGRDRWSRPSASSDARKAPARDLREE